MSDIAAVHVDAFSDYVIGLPMLMAITLANHTRFTSVRGPQWTPFTEFAPLSFELTDERGHTTELAAPDSSPVGPPFGAGATRTMLFDLSLLSPSVKPGAYELHVVHRQGEARSRSPAVPIHVATMTSDEAKAASALLAPLPEASWALFLSGNWRTVKQPHLSPRAAALLAFHLFMHRAIYAPQPVAQIDPAPLEHWPRPLEAEAALLRFEILHARHDPAASSEALLRRWPGLAQDVKEAERGEGLIASLRQMWGAEQQRSRPPATTPYAP
jgi:hypothetical protein